jgi:hypothetical protein
MKDIRKPALAGRFLPVIVAACLGLATQARSADAVPPGTWKGEIRILDPSGKFETIIPVKFDWRTTDVELPTNTLRYFGTMSCTLSAQYAGHDSAGHQFALKGAGGGHCDKASLAVLKPEANGLHLTVRSPDHTVLDDTMLQPDPPASTPAAH